MKELKPCPFCGHDVKMNTTEFFNDIKIIEIRCINCGARMASLENNDDWLAERWNNHISEKPTPEDTNDQFLEYLQKELEAVKAENKKLKNENGDLKNRFAKIEAVIEYMESTSKKRNWWRI